MSFNAILKGQTIQGENLIDLKIGPSGKFRDMSRPSLNELNSSKTGRLVCIPGSVTGFGNLDTEARALLKVYAPRGENERSRLFHTFCWLLCSWPGLSDYCHVVILTVYTDCVHKKEKE